MAVVVLAVGAAQALELTNDQEEQCWQQQVQDLSDVDERYEPDQAESEHRGVGNRRSRTTRSRSIAVIRGRNPENVDWVPTPDPVHARRLPDRLGAAFGQTGVVNSPGKRVGVKFETGHGPVTPCG